MFERDLLQYFEKKVERNEETFESGVAVIWWLSPNVEQRQ